MKLITSLTAIIAAASAGRVFSQPPAEQFAHAPDVYQSAAELHAAEPPGAHAQAPGAHGAYTARPGDAHAQILAYHSESDGHNYQYAYETDNGIKAQETGAAAHGSRAHGGYSYTGDDGHVYSVEYVADEHGFRAAGAHLPTPPPIPAAILRALEQNAHDEAAGIHDDGSYHEQHQQAQNYQLDSYQQDAHHAASQAEGGYQH
ncbi:cuticle protein 3-like [Bicyclus anynana]|uniref:Cuticle protein 3-like n=1 Tax=Bicyclus anynana TaxID=110368 RepID=A0A6J1NHR6_BICAN|nr:cuticle protein 3-like [Bicyclus anynana]